MDAVIRRYAIREIGTEKYMPLHRGARRGFSHDNPTEGGGDYGPRLFDTAMGAKNAISGWCRGKFKNSVHDYGDGNTYEELEVEPVAGRHREKLEVVCFKLVEVPE